LKHKESYTELTTNNRRMKKTRRGDTLAAPIDVEVFINLRARVREAAEAKLCRREETRTLITALR